MNINNHPQTNDLYNQKLNNRELSKTVQTVGESKSGTQPIGEKVELSKLDALRNEPDIRPEMVARGKELLNDSSFPSKEIVDSIAKLIVPFDDEV